jgi:hypothetical protein
MTKSRQPKRICKYCGATIIKIESILTWVDLPYKDARCFEKPGINRHAPIPQDQDPA